MTIHFGATLLMALWFLLYALSALVQVKFNIGAFLGWLALAVGVALLGPIVISVAG